MLHTRVAGCNAQYARLPFADFVSAQLALGVREIEFVAQTPHLWCDHIACEDEGPLRSALDDAGIRLAAFTPKAYRYSLFAEVGSDRQRATLAYVENTMLLAKRMGAELYCLEAGGATFDTSGDDLLKWAHANLITATKLAEEIGVSLCLGVADADTSPVLSSLADLAALHKGIRAVHGGTFRVVLDTQRMSVRGETITDWFDTFGDDVALVRFVDGNYHGYRPWGEGCLPCRGYLSELARCGYRGVLSQHRRGEGEFPVPHAADGRNIEYLRGVMGEDGEY